MKRSNEHRQDLNNEENNIKSKEQNNNAITVALSSKFSQSPYSERQRGKVKGFTSSVPKTLAKNNQQKNKGYSKLQKNRNNSPSMKSSQKFFSSNSSIDFSNNKSIIPQIHQSSTNKFSTLTNETINDQIKKSSEILKEKRLYNQRINSMKKRIVALIQEEQKLNKRMAFLKSKEKEEKAIKSDKENLKKECEKVKIVQEKELENKKIIVAKKSSQLQTKKIQDKLIQTQEKKKNDYKQAIDERDETRAIIEKIDKDYIENNKKTYSKAQEEKRRVRDLEVLRSIEKEEALKSYYIDKTEKDEKEADKLKKEYEELERIEAEMMNRLKQSRQYSTEMSERVILVKKLQYEDKNRKKKLRKNKKSNSTSTSPSTSFRNSKPFRVRKPGCEDTYHLTHCTMKSPLH